MFILKQPVESVYIRLCSFMESKRARIVDCKPKPNYHVWILFDDGVEGEVDLNHLVGKGVFEAWKSVEFFNQVRIDPKSDTLAWGEEIDLDPYVLREKVIHPTKKPSIPGVIQKSGI